MNAIVSQSSIAADPGPSAPAPASACAIHPSQPSLDPLVKAGIVTHMVYVKEALDPLFAVAQMRDLPEIHFVAAFQDGLIGLGCKDGLPADLVGIAHPVTPASPDAAAAPDFSKRFDMIESALARLEKQLAMEGESGSDALEPLISRIDGLEKHLQRQGSQEDMGKIAELQEPLQRIDVLAQGLTALSGQVEKLLTENATTEMRSKFDQLLQAIPAPVDLAPLRAAVEQTADRITTAQKPLEEKLETIAAAIEASPQNNDLAEQLERLGEGIGAVAGIPGLLDKHMANLVQHLKTARPQPASDANPWKDDFEKFAAVLTMIVKRIEGSAADIKAAHETRMTDPGIERLCDDVGTLSDLLKTGKADQNALKVILERLDQMRGRIDADRTLADQVRPLLHDLRCGIDALGPTADISRQIAEIARTLLEVREEGPELQKVARQIDLLVERGADVPDLLRRLQAQINNLFATKTHATSHTPALSELGALLATLLPHQTAHQNPQEPSVAPGADKARTGTPAVPPPVVRAEKEQKADQAESGHGVAAESNGSPSPCRAISNGQMDQSHAAVQAEKRDEKGQMNGAVHAGPDTASQPGQQP